MTVLDPFDQVRVLCVGDVMLDRFVSGTVHRVSPESPVPVLSIRDTQSFPGGAANVARNIAALGGRCTLIGLVGDDAAGAELRRALRAVGGVAPSLVTCAARPTTEKLRFVAQGQQLLRADQEAGEALTAELEQLLLQRIAERLPGHGVLVLSDYAKGVLSPVVVQGAIALARARHVPVVVDPKSSDMRRYAGATVVTPNAKEAQAATGIDPTEHDADAARAGQRMRLDGALHAVLVTRAHRGMTLAMHDGAAVHLAASAREVFDVVGAGDTVVATLALAIGAGHPLIGAARLANAAAGLVVGKRGTATVSRSELRQELARLDAARPGADPLDAMRDKVIDLPTALARAAAWRRDGHALGFTNGCFDLLHPGHLSLLGFARQHCGRLIVALNSDASMRLLKGPGRPVTAERDRAMLLAALAAVDAVVLFDAATPIALIDQLAPDALFKGGDYRPEDIVGADLVRQRGGQVLTCELVSGHSTARVLDAARHALDRRAAVPMLAVTP